MKKTLSPIFVLSLLFVSLLLSTTACHEESEPTPVKPEPDTPEVARIDSLGLYYQQIDPGNILCNSIYIEDGKYVLDLSMDDAFDFGIDFTIQEILSQQVESINNSGLETKLVIVN